MKTELSGPMHIVVCANEKFALGAWMTIWSAWKHHAGPEKPVFHLITPDAEAPDMRRIQALAAAAEINVCVKRADLGAVQELPCSDRLPIFAYLRLLAPLMLDGIEEFLYLDSDVLVRANVEDLRRDVQNGWTVAAARDYFHQTLEHGLPEIFDPELGGLRPYFNSGVMWVNADFWRREKITEQCLEYLAAEGREVQHGDQDALNAVFAGSFAPLDATWNMQAGAIDYFDRTEWPASQKDLLSRRSELLEDAKIVHFIGPAKPWDDGLRTAYAAEYRQEILKSGWVRPGLSQWWMATWFCKSLRHAVKRRCAV